MATMPISTEYPNRRRFQSMAEVRGRYSLYTRRFHSLAIPRAKDVRPDTGERANGKHEVESQNLSSDLWEKLPLSLIEQIVAKLPFSQLVRLCSVCRRWRDLVVFSKIAPHSTSGHGRLFLYSWGAMSVFSPTRGMWETVSLQLLQKQYRNLTAVASAGGLLCFCTSVLGEFVVCNPLTKSYKRLQMPCGEDLRNGDQPCMPTPLPARLNLNVLASAFLVGMVVDFDAGHFQLVVAGTSPGSRCTTLVYNSCADAWKKVGDIPDSVVDQKLKPIACGSNLCFCSNGGEVQDSLLKYDLEHEVWSWIPIPDNMGYLGRVTEFNGKVLLIATVGRDPLPVDLDVEFFELQDSISPMWEPANPLPLTNIRGAFPPIGNSDCLSQGDVLYFVLGGTNFSAAAGGFTSKDICAWFHNVKTNSDVLLSWEACRIRAAGVPLLQIFTPSLMPVK